MLEEKVDEWERLQRLPFQANEIDEFLVIHTKIYVLSSTFVVISGGVENIKTSSYKICLI